MMQGDRRGGPSSGMRPPCRRSVRPPWATVLVALQLAVTVVPTVVVCAWAFADSWPWPKLMPDALSLRGMRLVIGEAQGISTVGRSVVIALASSLLSTVTATLAARAIHFHAWRGRGPFEFSILLPFLVPSTVFAMGVQIVFVQMGLAGKAVGVVLAHAIVSVPYAFAIMGDAVRLVGHDLEDAARVSGASWPRTIWCVSLPLLAPAVASSLSMCYIMSFSQYFLTLLVGAGRVRTFALALFPYLSGGDRTVAASYGVVFLASILVIFSLFELVLSRAAHPVVEGASLSGRGRAAGPRAGGSPSQEVGTHEG